MTRAIFIVAALALAATLSAVPAQAQATRAFVSAAGSDNNNCINTTTPCRHFQNAYNAMPNGGEIDVLDPGNYGALAVTHALDIVGRGWATVGAASGLASITINAGPSDKINITGVLLDGANITGTTGIQFNSGANLTVTDSVIQNFASNGISFQPTGSSGISVSRTVAGKNGGYGILVQPKGSASATADFEQVQTQYNGTNAYGISIDATATTGAINATATDSISSNNGGGFIAESTGAGTTLMLVRCTASNNPTGVQVGGGVSKSSRGIVYMSQVAITGNATGWQVATTSGTGLFSYGDNTIDGNTNGDTAPPSIAKK
jgi:hypothetical protein